MAWPTLDNPRRHSANNAEKAFKFTAGTTEKFFFSPLPSTTSLPVAPYRDLKRGRPLADVDGEGVIFDRKKRRLRLNHVTSRLSRPFSVPTSYTVDHGASKIAVWAKQKAVGRISLRKAAILNCIRRQTIEKKQDIQRESTRAAATPKETEQASEAHKLDPDIPPQIPRRSYIPLPPSPLGLSNYDAFDLEDTYQDENEDSSEVLPLYSDFNSDFNILTPSEPLVEHDSIQSEPVPRVVAAAPDDCSGASCTFSSCTQESDILCEQQRQKKFFLIPFIY